MNTKTPRPIRHIELLSQRLTDYGYDVRVQSTDTQYVIAAFGRNGETFVAGSYRNPYSGRWNLGSMTVRGWGHAERRTVRGYSDQALAVSVHSFNYRLLNREEVTA